MKTTHRTIFQNASRLSSLENDSVDLVVTSPPYPMIEMWDDLFCSANPDPGPALEGGRGLEAFELMHRQLDPVWREVYRVLRQGGFACINIGDATRTLNHDFCLYPNHARILQTMLGLGFSALPEILWRKQTNAPNKFMGSGMLPAGAYVTLEHEHILILRKGGKREFSGGDAKQARRDSALFWEERNVWFSDIWFDIKGSRQRIGLKNSRLRSAAFPFELAYRLINMYSVRGDLVLDPFVGTGTTLAAAMSTGRNSVGYEIDPAFGDSIAAWQDEVVGYANSLIGSRIDSHNEFVLERTKAKGPPKHRNRHYDFPVMTRQEMDLAFYLLDTVRTNGDLESVVTYNPDPLAAAQGIGLAQKKRPA